ncbi:MAG: AAA family ATPase [archaeon]
MNIKKIYLKNIRSYEEAEISFPEGSVLLSGDIGSGKTTVLLAFDFALFGLQRGLVSGGALLRNGKTVGNVRVHLEIEGKEIIIERTLKKTKDSIVQDSGFITIDDERKELSATELKNSVLKLLNYPPEFLTKTDVLYRYTVYTPQESMKEILIERADARMETLRRVFGIDKYKAIISNINIFLSKLRDTIKIKEAAVSYIDPKKASLEESQKKIGELNTILVEIRNEHKASLQKLNMQKENFSRMEKEIEELNSTRTEIARKKSEFDSAKEHLSRIGENLNALENQIKVIKESLKDVKTETVESIESALSHQQNEINRLQDMYTKLEKKISELKAQKSEKEKIARGIKDLNVCPVCMQKVSSEHKHDFILKSDSDTAEITAELNKYEKMCAEKTEKLETSKKTLKEIQIKEKDINLIKVNLHRLEEKEADYKKNNEDKENTGAKSEKLRKEIEVLIEKLKRMSETENNYKNIQALIEIAQADERKIAIKNAQTEKEIEGISNLSKTLKKELEEIEKIRQELFYLIKMRNWLQDKFIPLMSNIEQEVMAKVHAEFSSVFNNWFTMLVFGLTVRLDESFTPIIEANGYELDYGFLSGGERTAAALAYRLALNQVINSLMSRIKTRDILILDEPTDGFSYEQLDKMRDVLHELKAKQIILVSHETKIESFVDNIIRFKKEENKTSIN